jgi:hypothetical protein
MERVVCRPRTVRSTIEAAIKHVLVQDKIDNRLEFVFRSLKIAGIIQEHDIEVNIALQNIGRRIDATIRPSFRSMD